MRLEIKCSGCGQAIGVRHIPGDGKDELIFDVCDKCKKSHKCNKDSKLKRKGKYEG